MADLDDSIARGVMDTLPCRPGSACSPTSLGPNAHTWSCVRWRDRVAAALRGSLAAKQAVDIAAAEQRGAARVAGAVEEALSRASYPDDRGVKVVNASMIEHILATAGARGDL